MGNRKEFAWMLIIIIFALLIILGILYDYSGAFDVKEKFNPEKHICEECESRSRYDNKIYKKEIGHRAYFSCSDKEFLNEGITKCLRFRSKNQCELGNESWKEEKQYYIINGGNKQIITTDIKIFENNNKLWYIPKGDFNDQIRLPIQAETICREKTKQEIEQEKQEYYKKYPADANQCECIKEIFKGSEHWCC